MASTSLMTLGGPSSTTGTRATTAGFTKNPISGPIPGFAANTSPGAGFYPATRSGVSGFDLNSLLNRLSGIRPFQDVNLPAAPDISRVQVQAPSRSAYGSVDKSALGQLAADMGASRGEFYSPTSSGAFKNLMNLASATTARQAEETSRLSQEAAARRGYVGGYSAETERAARERMRNLATAGFEGAKNIREEAGALLGQQTGAYAGLAGDLERSATARAVAYGQDLAAARRAQAEADLGYNSNLISLFGARNEAALGQGQLREMGRAHDIEGLTGLARLGIDAFQGQNEMALLERRAQLEEQAAQSAEERRRSAKEFDFQFGEKHANEARKRTFEDAVAQDPHLRFLAQQAASNPLARLALEKARRSFKF